MNMRPNLRFHGNDINGAVLMPFGQTFFALKFGMTNDRFGVRWMIGVAPAVAAP